MRLKSIKLAGFKSFVDPTTVPFPHNLSTIVGPNGCGKSNVIDAVRWVMGESSAKHLRGQHMTDVIFNGSTGRQPVGQASIELLFDNSEGKLIGEYAGYNEISVKRRLTRDGVSAYFLNNSRCRRKDIADLFLGTGLGPRSYAVIEQGMISRLIEAKPEELRVYLEEAAGISRYKERRRETENRISHTRDNLDRLNDLREELERQLRTLKRQSESAEKYKIYREEERTLKAQLHALNWQQLDVQREELARKLSASEIDRERLMSEQAGLDRQIEDARERLAGANEESNQRQAGYYEVQSSITAREQEIRHQEQRSQQFESDLAQTRSSVAEAQAHLKADNERQQALAEELAGIGPSLEESRTREQQSTARLQESEQRMQAWQTEWEAFKARSEEPRREAEVQQARIQQHERNIERFRARILNLEKEEATLSTGELENELEALRKQAGELEQTVSAHQESISSVVAEIQERRAGIQSKDAELETARQSLSKLRGRQASLEELQQRALGRRGGAIAKWMQAEGLSDARRLAECIEVDAGWEKALETVLGEYLQAACTNDLGSLAGRAAGVEGGVLTLIDESVGSGANAGVSSSLLSRVRSDLDLGSLLSGIHLADDLDAAMAMRATLAPGESVVTRDGVLLGRNWMRVAGGDDERSGVLARQQELEALLISIQTSDATVSLLREQIQTLRDGQRELEERREVLQRESNESSRKLSEVRSRVSARQARLEQVMNRARRLAEELQEQRDHLGHEDVALSESRDVWQKALASIELDQTEQERLLGDRDEQRSRLDESRQQARLDRDRTHELAIREQGIRSQLDTLQQALGRLQSQISGLEDRAAQLTRNLTEASEPLDGMRVALQALLTQRVDSERLLSSARDKVAVEEKSIRELEQNRSSVEQGAGQVSSSVEQFRINLRGLEVQQENLLGQLTELNCSLEEVKSAMPEEASLAEWEETLRKVQNRIQRLGAINLAAIDEYQTQSERKTYMDAQYEDLTEALETLESAIRKIDRETRSLFRETFDKVNSEFSRLFPTVFGGGRAYLELTGEDLLDTGVIIRAQPPGKKNGTISALSGGEKAMTAISLVFSIFNLNPAPFCMLDEVDAPLDDTNTERFASLVETMSAKVQFIVITHKKSTMEVSRQLMGVTMHEPGVSRLVSVDLEEMV